MKIFRASARILKRRKPVEEPIDNLSSVDSEIGERFVSRRTQGNVVQAAPVHIPASGPSFDNHTTHAPVSGMQYRDIITLINPFDGEKKNYKGFIADCEVAIARAGRDPKLVGCVLDYIISRCSRVGCTFARNFKYHSWDDVKALLEAHYSKKLTEADVVLSITSLKQESKTVFNYYGEFAELLKDYNKVLAADPDNDDLKCDLKIESLNKVALQAFEKGLRPDIRRSLVFQKPRSLKEAYELARTYEDKNEGGDAEDDLLSKLKGLILDKSEDKDFRKPTIKRMEAVV